MLFRLKTSERSSNIIKNVAYITVIKGISLAVSFMIIPITIDYVSKSTYGIWLTMFSIVNWLGMFDIGLGNGLRNKLSEAIAQKNKKSATEYVSTAYFAIIAIAVVLLCISIPLCSIIDWISLLKLPDDYHYDISLTMATLFCFFCLRFVVQLVSIIYYAVQKSFMVELCNMCGNLLSLFVVYCGRNYFTEDKLLFLVCALCVPPIIMMVFFSIRLYCFGAYSYLRPRYSMVRTSKMSSLMSLGVKFFILQICSLITYSMTNFLILQFLNPDDVTYYNVAYKYFSALLILNNIFCMPLWSAFTEAYALKDYPWIANCIRKLTRLFIIICAAGLLMFAISPTFYRIWLQNKIEIPVSLSLMTLLFILTCCFNGIVISFINGVGKVRLQTLIAILTTLIYIPACKLLAVKLEFGVTGFVGYMFAINLISAVCSAIQTRKIFKNKAHGIWNA